MLGGWVRDKLLGLSNNGDIDLALDDMEGGKFALLVNRWSARKGEEVNFIFVLICGRLYCHIIHTI